MRMSPQVLAAVLLSMMCGLGTASAQDAVAGEDQTEPETVRIVSTSSPAEDGPAPDRFRLRWGAALDENGGRSEETSDAGEEVEAEGGLSWRQRRIGGSWRFRILLPEFHLIAGANPDTICFGSLQGFQLELYNKHVITMAGFYGFGDGFSWGFSVGYSYEMDLVPGIVRLEFRAMLGVAFWERWNHWDDHDNSNFGILTLQPMIHVGYEWFFFSVGPHIVAIPGIAGGITTGFFIRL